MSEQGTCQCSKQIEIWYADHPGYWHVIGCPLWQEWDENSLPTAQMTAHIDALEREVQELQDALAHASVDVEQTLGKALGYPWYKDDPKNFPGATEANGVCVGDHVPETLAAEAANMIRKLQAKAALADEKRRPVYITWAGTPLKFRAECPDCHCIQPLEEHPKTSDGVEKVRREFQHGDWCWLARYDALVSSEEGTNG